MGKRKAVLAARAWELLRLALLWARKGGAFKPRLFSSGAFLKGMWNRGSSRLTDGYQIRQGDRELSFGDTPVFRLGGRSSSQRSGSMRQIIGSILCLNPPPHGSLGFDGDDKYAGSSREAFFLRSYSESNDENGEEEFISTEWMEGTCEAPVEDDSEEEQNGVDLRAEEFIARFHRQMKLQRQESLLEYHEMLNRGA